MKAMVMTAFGTAEVLTLQNRPEPVVGPRDLLIEVRASSVNPVDCKTRTAPRWGNRQPPMILGFDVAGIVRAVGAAVTEFAVGDEVYGSPSLLRDGANAEFVCLDAAAAAHRPRSLDFAACAALPLATLTAWEALHQHARLQSTDTVLIQGGAGGVGHIASQLARLAGCTVYATAGRDESLQAITDNGAIALDYRRGAIAEQLLAATAGLGASVVLDCVGGAVFTDSLACAARRGRVVTIVPGVPTDGINTLFGRNVSVHFEFMGMAAMTGDGIGGQQAILQAAARLADGGLLTPRIAHTYPLADLPAAHRQQESGRTIGKLLVIP